MVFGLGNFYKKFKKGTRNNKFVPQLGVTDMGVSKTGFVHRNTGNINKTRKNTALQNRLKRVLTLLNKDNFTKFFPVKLMSSGKERNIVEHNDNTGERRNILHNPTTDGSIYNPKTNVHTIYDYGSLLRTESNPKMVSEAYNDLLVMIIQLMFLQSKLILDNGLTKLIGKMKPSEEKSRIQEKIASVKRESNATVRNSNPRIRLNEILRNITLTVWTGLALGTLFNITIGTMGLGAVIAILVLVPSTAAANAGIKNIFDKQTLILLERNGLALRRVFKIIFDTRNIIRLDNAQGIDWPFNEMQKELLYKIGERYGDWKSGTNKLELEYDDDFYRLVSKFMLGYHKEEVPKYMPTYENKPIENEGPSITEEDFQDRIRNKSVPSPALIADQINTNIEKSELPSGYDEGEGGYRSKKHSKRSTRRQRRG